jgi:hypothetical protein
VTAKILTPDEVRALLAEGREGAAEMERKRRKRGAMADDVDALRAEIRRLRSLPLIPSCGACGWPRPCAAGAWRCGHPSAVLDGNAIDPDEVPPVACPLRGAR